MCSGTNPLHPTNIRGAPTSPGPRRNSLSTNTDWTQRASVSQAWICSSRKNIRAKQDLPVVSLQISGISSHITQESCMQFKGRDPCRSQGFFFLTMERGTLLLREGCWMHAFGLSLWHWCLVQKSFFFLLCQSLEHISVQLQSYLGSWPMNVRIICWCKLHQLRWHPWRSCWECGNQWKYFTRRTEGHFFLTEAILKTI